MDLNLTPDERQFRDEFRAWLAANVPPPFTGSTSAEDRAEHIAYLKRWQRTLFEGGWAGISWPKQYGGRGATLMQQAIFQEELALANAPHLIGTIGLSLVGPTLIAMGSESQKAQHLAKILSGEEIWCQGFSEPNAGSDLASLGTKAIRDGDDFVVNGQKIWTSFAQMADYCLLLVRTDFESPKHKGITCLLADMKTTERMPSEIKIGHARQVALYAASDNLDARLIYVTPRKLETYRLENVLAHREALRKIAMKVENLLSLSDESRHGYAIIQEIAGRTEGLVSMRTGTMYLLLQRMVADGLIEESAVRPKTDQDDERRRYYVPTSRGRAVAAAEAKRLEAMVSQARRKQVLGRR